MTIPARGQNLIDTGDPSSYNLINRGNVAVTPFTSSTERNYFVPCCEPRVITFPRNPDVVFIAAESGGSIY